MWHNLECLAKTTFGSEFSSCFFNSSILRLSPKLSFFFSPALSRFLLVQLFLVDMTGSYVAPITPTHLSVCCSGVGGWGEAQMTAECLLSPPGGTDAHIFVWAGVWVSGRLRIQLLKPNGGEWKASNCVRAQLVSRVNWPLLWKKNNFLNAVWFTGAAQ